jgi:hypothetical protein
MRKSDTGSSIDASCTIFLYLTMWFQKRRFLEIDHQKQELPMAAMFINGSGRNEQSL